MPCKALVPDVVCGFTSIQACRRIELAMQETTEAKATINKLQAQLVGKDLAIEENLASVSAHPL